MFTQPNHPARPYLWAALAVLSISLAAGAEPRTITMTGTGNVGATPDQVEIFTSVECDGKTASEALTANSRSMNAVYAVAKKFGLGEKAVTTSNFSLQPVRDERKTPANGGITGYRVANSVTVTATEIAKAGALIDALVSAGANQIGAVTFSIRNEAPLLTKARELAVQDATEKATSFAHAAGVSLGPVQTISEDGQSARRYAKAETVMMTRAQATPVAAGDQMVSASVTITWTIP